MTPYKYIWIQVAGLTDEHLALLRFAKNRATDKTSFEEARCFGKMWSYNLFKLRPSAYEGFWSQLTGKSNIVNSCEDFKLTPIWNYMHKSGYKIGIFESGVNNRTSIDYAKKCGEEAKKQILDGVTLWRMNPAPDSNSLTFHVQGARKRFGRNTYFDKSCQQSGCYTNLAANVVSVYERFSHDNDFFLFLVRDFSYLNSLADRKLDDFKTKLLEIEKVFSYFAEEVKKDPRLLLVLSSSAPVNFELPKKGREWYHFERQGKFIKFHNTSLVAPVFAMGARAENFCGFFEESQIFLRMIRGRMDSKLKYKINTSL